MTNNIKKDNNLGDITNFYDIGDTNDNKVEETPINNSVNNPKDSNINKESNFIDEKKINKGDLNKNIESNDSNILSEGIALYTLDKLGTFTGIKKKQAKIIEEKIEKTPIIKEKLKDDDLEKKFFKNNVEKNKKDIEKEKKINEKKQIENIKKTLVEEKKQEKKKISKDENIKYPIDQFIRPKKIIEHSNHLEIFPYDDKHSKITFFVNIYPNNGAYMLEDIYSIISNISNPEELEFNLFYITKSLKNLQMLAKLKNKEHLYKQAIYESGVKNIDTTELNIRLGEIEELKYSLISNQTKIYDQSIVLQIITKKENFNEYYLGSLFDNIKKLDFKVNRLHYIQKEIYDNILNLVNLDINYLEKNVLSNYAINSFELPKLNFISNFGYEDSNGIFIGKNFYNGNMVFKDIWQGSNYNFFVVGKSGGGKSYSIKTILTREYSKNVNVFVIDPEGEFRKLTKEIGGTLIDIRDEGNKINPFDFNYIHGIEINDVKKINDKKELVELQKEIKTEYEIFILGLESLLKLILIKEGHGGDNLYLIPKAIMKYYEKLGVDIKKTSSFFKLQKNIGNIKDFYNTLKELEKENEQKNNISNYLEKYVHGIYGDLFGQDKTKLKFGNWVCFDFANFDDELRHILMFLVSRSLAGFMTSPKYKHILKRLVIDEAHLFFQDIQIVTYFLQILKRGRKYKMGIGLITQTINDFFSKYRSDKLEEKEIGNDIVNNVSFQLVFGQKGKKNIESVQEKLSLNNEEMGFIESISQGKNPGKCLLITEEGGHRNVVALQIEAEDYLKEIIED